MKIVNFFEKIKEKLWDHLGNIWDKLKTSVYPETTSEKNTLLFKSVKLKTGEFNLLWKLKKNNFYSFS